MSEVVEKRQKLPALKPETTSEERTWAALAHASTLFFGLFMFVPFVIYLVYKDKSQYVAYHAAQAFAIQLVGTVGWVLGFLVLSIIWTIALVISGILIAVLVGIILLPIVALIGPAVLTAWTALPFVITGASVWAIVETAGGKAFDYPYLGEWIAERLTNNGDSQPVENPPTV